MRKGVNDFVFVVMILFGFQSFAQESGFGVKGGLNYSFYSSDLPGVENKSGIGFNIGGFYRHMFLDNFGVQPEVLYSLETVNKEIAGVKRARTFNYIDINVVPKFFLTETVNIEGVIGVGIGVGQTYKENGVDQASVDHHSALTLGLGVGYDFESGLGVNFRWINRVYSDVSFNTINLGVDYKF